MSRLSGDLAYWLRIARTDPSKAYCPECSYPLRWTGADMWGDDAFACDSCHGADADRDERPAEQPPLLEVDG